MQFKLWLSTMVLAGAISFPACAQKVTYSDIRNLQNQINSEVSARKAADNQINQELATLKATLETLKTASAANSTAIKALEDRIAALEGATPTPTPDPTPTPTPDPTPTPGSVFPNTADGKPIMQLGIDGFHSSYPHSDLTFADWTMLMGASSWLAESPWQETNRLPFIEFNELWEKGHIDKVTHLPKSIPAGYSHIRSALFRSASRYPEYYAGKYIVEWEGDADIQFGFGLRQCPQAAYSCQQKINANRIEATFLANDYDWTQLQIKRIGAGFKNLRIYRAEQEVEAKAGKLNPDFLAYAKQYKILRVMDSQAVVVSTLRSADRIRKEGQFGIGSGWTVENLPADITIGAPLKTYFDIVKQTDSTLWIHIPPLIGAPDVFAGKTPDTISGDTLKELARTNTQAILSSVEHRKFADAIVKAMVDGDYPRNYTLYVERANEIWNFAHPFWWATNYYWGIALGLGNPVGIFPSYGLGYLAAHDAVQMKAALAAAGRSDQAWVIVIGTQMANTETTRGALAGVKRYFTDKGIDPAPYLKHIGISTASYYNGTFGRNGLIKAADDTAHKQAWLDAIASDPVGLRKRAADYIINGPSTQAESLANLVELRNKHQAMAAAAGVLFVGDYEGESHDNPPNYLSDDATFKAWIEGFRNSSDQERLTKAWVEAMRAQNPNAVIANYRGISLGAPSRPHPLAAAWDDGFYGEDTARKRALRPFLRQ